MLKVSKGEYHAKTLSVQLCNDMLLIYEVIIFKCNFNMLVWMIMIKFVDMANLYMT
jgi:hypothetical protein